MKRSRLLIQKLKEAEVPQVVFFVNGRYACAQNGFKHIQLYTEAGHLIANHSYHHRSLENRNAVSFANDILKADNILKNIPNFRKWYRFPMLNEGNTREKRDYIRSLLKRHGYINGCVTIDNWDFYINKLLKKGLSKGKKLNKANLRRLYLEYVWNAIEFYDNIARQYYPHPLKHTLLLHDNDVTAMFIKDLVELIREKGWIIISPEEAYKDNLVNIAPDVLMNNQGRIMALAASQGYDGPYRYRDENNKSIENLFIQYNVWEN